MSVHLLKPSEIKSLLALVDKMNYTFKTFIGDGDFSKTLLLEDCDNQHQVVGKVVERYNVGEFQIWPRLQHENLNPLLDMMANDDGTTLFVCPLVGKSLRDVIEDSGFGQHPKCFERKKRYARDILSGLEYLHQNSVCLMNLTDNSVLINSSLDKAIISDFSRALNVSSSDQVIRFESEGITLPPEATENDIVHPKPFDIWTCGFMFLQMFTKHVLPWCSLGTDLLDGLDIELLKRTNKSSNLKDDAATDLNVFLKSFLWTQPNLRVTASEALSSWYLGDSSDRLDEPAREFWKTASVIMPYNTPNGQFLGEGDMKSSTIDNKLPLSSKLLNPLIKEPRSCDGLRSGKKPSPKTDVPVIYPSDDGSMASKNCGLREIKKDSTTGTSDLPDQSNDPSPSLWSNEVSSDAREKLRENLNRIKEKFKLMRSPTNMEYLSSVENELTSIPTIKIETVNSPPSHSSNSSFGLEKLFIQNKTPPQNQTKSVISFLKEQFSSPENNFPADRFNKGSLKSLNCSSQWGPRHDIKIQEPPLPETNFPSDQLFKRSPKFSFQPVTRHDVKIPEAEKFLWPENNLPSVDESFKESHKSVGPTKTEKLPKIKIEGNFLPNKLEKGNAPKLPPSVNPTFEGFRLTCRMRKTVNETANEKPRFHRSDSPYPSRSSSPPSHSRWPTTAEMKLKHSLKLLGRNKQSFRRKDRSKSTEKKPAAKPNATETKPAAKAAKPKATRTKPAAKPKATGAKTEVKTAKPVAILPEKTMKPKATETKSEAKAVKPRKQPRSKTKECLDVTAVQSGAIDVSLDTPPFTYGQPKPALAAEDTKKKKRFFHLPCRKSKSGKQSKDKSKFAWF